MGTLITVVPQNASLLWPPGGTFTVQRSHTATHTRTHTHIHTHTHTQTVREWEYNWEQLKAFSWVSFHQDAIMVCREGAREPVLAEKPSTQSTRLWACRFFYQCWRGFFFCFFWQLHICKQWREQLGLSDVAALVLFLEYHNKCFCRTVIATQTKNPHFKARCYIGTRWAQDSGSDARLCVSLYCWLITLPLNLFMAFSYSSVFLQFCEV